MRRAHAAARALLLLGWRIVSERRDTPWTGHRCAHTAETRALSHPELHFKMRFAGFASAVLSRVHAGRTRQPPPLFFFRFFLFRSFLESWGGGSSQTQLHMCMCTPPNDSPALPEHLGACFLAQGYHDRPLKHPGLQNISQVLRGLPDPYGLSYDRTRSLCGSFSIGTRP